MSIRLAVSKTYLSIVYPKNYCKSFFNIFFLWNCPQSSGSVGCSFAGHWLIFRWQLFSQPTHIHYFTILI